MQAGTPKPEENPSLNIDLKIQQLAISGKRSNLSFETNSSAKSTNVSVGLAVQVNGHVIFPRNCKMIVFVTQAWRCAASTCTARSTNHSKASNTWRKPGNSKCGPEWCLEKPKFNARMCQTRMWLSMSLSSSSFSLTKHPHSYLLSLFIRVLQMIGYLWPAKGSLNNQCDKFEVLLVSFLRVCCCVSFLFTWTPWLLPNGNPFFKKGLTILTFTCMLLESLYAILLDITASFLLLRLVFIFLGEKKDFWSFAHIYSAMLPFVGQ